MDIPPLQTKAPPPLQRLKPDPRSARNLLFRAYNKPWERYKDAQEQQLGSLD
jgi:cation transport regulator ChaB